MVDFSCFDASGKESAKGITDGRKERRLKREEMNALLGMTEEEMEEIADQFENDTWEGEWTNVVYGRPCLYGEKMVTVSFRIPAYLKDAIDSTIESSDISRSQFFRNAICREILRCQMHELYGQEEDVAAEAQEPEVKSEKHLVQDQVRAMPSSKSGDKAAA